MATFKSLTARISRVGEEPVTPLDGYFLWDLHEAPSSAEVQARIKRFDAGPSRREELELIRVLYLSGIHGKTVPIRANAAKLSPEGRHLLLSMFGRAAQEGLIPESEIGGAFFREVALGLGFDQVSAEEPMTFRDPTTREYYVRVASAIIRTHQKSKPQAQKLAFRMIQKQERHSVLSIASPNTPGWLDLALSDAQIVKPPLSLAREANVQSVTTWYSGAGTGGHEAAWLTTSRQGIAAITLTDINRWAQAQEAREAEKRKENARRQKLTQDLNQPLPVVPKKPDGTIDRSQFEAALRNSYLAKQLEAYRDETQWGLDQTFRSWMNPDSNGFVPDFLERANPDLDASAILSEKPNRQQGSAFTHSVSGDPLHHRSNVSTCYGDGSETADGLPLRYCYQRQADASAGRQMLRVEVGQNQEYMQFLLTGGLKFIERNGAGFHVGNPSLRSATIGGFYTQDFYVSSLGGKTTAFTAVGLDMPSDYPGSMVGSVDMGAKHCSAHSECLQLFFTYRQPDPQNAPLNGITTPERRIFLLFTTPAF